MERTTLETVVAIIVGIVLGTLVAVSLWLIKSGKMQLQLPNRTVAVPTAPSPKPKIKAISPALEISQPANYSIVNDKTITLSGRALNSSLIIITQVSGETITKADNNGAFKSNLALDEGDNEIIVTALWPDSVSRLQNLTIVYQKK